jgi:integrase
MPKALYIAKRNSFLKVSLGTRDPKTALNLSRILVHIGLQINRLGVSSNMRFDEVRQLLRDHFSQMLEKEKERIDGEGRLTPPQMAEFRAKMDDTEQAIAGGAEWFGKADDTQIMRAFMKKHNVDFAPDTDQYKWLKDDIKRAYLSYLREVLNYDLSLDQFDLSPQTPKLRASAVVAAKSSKVVTLEDIMRRYLTERMAGNVWAERTKIEKRDHTDLLLEIIPRDTDVSALTVHSAAAVKDALMRLPKNWRKLPQTRQLSLAAVLDLQGLERLKPASINKYLQTYADLFGWANSNGYTDRNHFSGLALKYDKVRTEQERKAFSDQQIRTILTHVVDGALINVRKPYQKWGPLIAAYSGARLNEIAQIELTDIKNDDGIWYFDISDEGEDKAVKTVASKRRIPIHSEILKAGLLEYVETLRQKGKRHLFHDLTYSREHGRGRNLGRWFNESLLPKLNLHDPAYVFHSFRHAVNAKLVEGVQNDPLIKGIMGHQQHGMTYSVYLKQGFKLAQLREAVETLSYAE